MAKTQVLSVDLLRIDAGTQSRISIDEDVVEDYAELIESNGEWPLGPLDVFHDGNDHLVADGFHRTLAAVKARRNSVPCRVHKGTAKDARIFGMTANDRHGLRMSRADKRACVEWLLDQPGKQQSQTQIAELSGVSRRTVTQIVADRKTKSAQTSQPSGGGGVNIENNSAEAELADDWEPCPNCGANDWSKDDLCRKCNHPYGEPVGDEDEPEEPDEPEWKVLKRKAVKTAEALVRAVDDLHGAKRIPLRHKQAESHLRDLLTVVSEWGS